MKKLILFLPLLSIGCAKYQVIQELGNDRYHLYSSKKGVEIVTTHDNLKIDKFYKLKQINIIDEEN